MPQRKTLQGFLDDVASATPAPGGGCVAALAGALGAALTSMVSQLTIGKKKYAGVEEEMREVLAQAEDLRAQFTGLIDKDARAFEKVMEAFALPKDGAAQQALRAAAVREATKEATLVPLEVMRHCIDGHALAQKVAVGGNLNAVSDAGVGAIMFHAACEAAALNVRINLNTLDDAEFVGWKTDDLQSLLNTSRAMAEETQEIVAGRMAKQG
jgi:formiminotetrahydrofolate cyclodeaminase